MSFSESMSYSDKIIFSKSSPYQRIVLTKGNRDIRLFLNGNLQFSSADEYRYHEALIHPGLQAVKNPQRVLVLGGGDGLAVREILKYPGLKDITLVDLDKEITHLFSSNPILTDLNKHSLESPKVKVINADAFQWLKNNKEKFDFIAVDVPDPSTYSVGKLYTSTFYKVLFKSLAEEGVVIVQSTSPFVAPKSFWCINNTLEAVGFHTIPYHTYIPSFGDWGYIMAMKHQSYIIPDTFINDLRFINKSTFSEMINFPKDVPKLSTEVNKLNNQVLVNYFEDEWAAYLQQ
jgi:spermidine synthase